MKLLIHQYDAELRNLAEDALEIRVLIAFMTEAGLSWLPREKFKVVDCIVGTGLGITTPEAIRTLMDGGANVHVFQDCSRLFHPKALYFRTREAEYLVVGSNNLTASGISSNYELSTLSTKNETNAAAFQDFLAHFENLRREAACGRPDQHFFENYRSKPAQQELRKKLLAQEIVPIQKESKNTGTAKFRSGESVRDLLKTIAEQFPVVKASTRRGSKIADHPLKKLNDDHLATALQTLVQRASSGRLEAKSSLNQGGNWRITPLISAIDLSKEPKTRRSKDGQLALQLHFGADFKDLRASLVLRYAIPISEKTGIMPDPVQKRFDRLIERLGGFADGAEVQGRSFRIFNRKEHNLSAWAHPILSYSYAIDALPSDSELEQNLESLAAALNEGAFIR